MISIKNIAERCGVSTATVSKALNDHKDVSELTKKLVRETKGLSLVSEERTSAGGLTPGIFIIKVG